MVRSVSISRICRVKKIQNRTAHDRSQWCLIWAFRYQSQLAFFKANTSAKKSKVFVQVARIANARATPLEQCIWNSNLSESSSLAWVIAKRESGACPWAYAERFWGGFTKSSWGSGGRCEPPSGVRGGAPEDFEINAFQRLRTPVSLSFLSQCC